MNAAAQTKNPDRLLKVLFLLALLIFIMIAVFVYAYPENKFDKYLQQLTHALAAPALLPFWIRVSFFGSFEFLFPAWVIFIGINIWKRRARFGLNAATVAIGGFLSMEFMKQIFRRHRPALPRIPDVMDYSFPSGHSTSSLIFCTVIMYTLWHTRFPKSIRIAGMSFMALLTFSVGLSRIILNVHYPTDVAAGFCFGMMWIVLWYRYIKNKPAAK